MQTVPTERNDWVDDDEASDDFLTDREQPLDQQRELLDYPGTCSGPDESGQVGPGAVQSKRSAALR